MLLRSCGFQGEIPIENSAANARKRPKLAKCPLDSILCPLDSINWRRRVPDGRGKNGAIIRLVGLAPEDFQYVA